MIYRVALLSLLALVPLAASAQKLNLSPLESIIGAVAAVIGTLIPILVTLGLAVFLWGLVRYLWGGGSEPEINNAKVLMKWGLVILFVMVSVWGIIDFMQRALNLDKNATGKAPQIQYSGSQGNFSPGGLY